jgi:hypothetical protein
MTLAEITASFLEHIRQNKSPVQSQVQSGTHERAMNLLPGYFSANAALTDMSASALRDFLARWYVEKACISKFSDSKTAQRYTPSTSTAGSRLASREHARSDQVPEPHEMLDSLEGFLGWAEQQTGLDLVSQASPIFAELRESLPRALKITDSMWSWLRDRGGAFTFPEFLTSFEEGGHGQYDIDAPGTVGAIEGFFRIVRVQGALVEAEDLISEARIWPIVFPVQVAALLDEGYIINLELARTREGWQIAGCGFAYPPGTDV